MPRAACAGYATPGRTVRDAVWSGPLRRYPPGRYRLWVRLKLDRAVAGRVRAVRRRARLARRGAGRARALGRRGPGARALRGAGRALHRAAAGGARVPVRVPRRRGRLVRSAPRRAPRGPGVRWAALTVAAVSLGAGARRLAAAPRGDLTRAAGRRPPARRAAGPHASVRRHAPALLPALARPRRPPRPDAALHRSLPVPRERPPLEPAADLPAAGAALHRALGLRPPRRLQPARPALVPRGRARRLRTRAPVSRATPPRPSSSGVGFALLPARLEPALRRPSRRDSPLALVPGDAVGARRGARATGGSPAAWAAARRSLALAMLEPQYTYLAVGLALAHAGHAARAGRPAGRLRLAPLAGLRPSWPPARRPGSSCCAQAFVAGSIAEAGRRIDEVRLFSPGPPRPRRAGPVRRARARGARRASASGARTRRRRQAPAPLRAALALGLLLSLGPTIPRFPLYQALHRWRPVLRDDPEPREAPAPDERGHRRPGGARRAGASWRAPRRGTGGAGG